jgi:hypothetical protein
MAKKFKVHNMYSKTGRVAKTEAEHNALERRGYGHTPPKKTAKKTNSSPLAKKGKDPSRKKSEGNYAAVKKGRGVGKKAGGGMTAKGVAKYRKEARKTKRAERKAPSRKKSEGNYAKVKKGGGTGKKAGGGMTAKGVAKYRKDNPGSKLKTAVTTPPSKLKKGSKAAKRRKSFCARSKSWKSERGLAARRKWNC